MLSHAEVVVRAPDHDVARRLAAVARGEGIAARVARQLGEDAVTALDLERVDPFREEAFVVHVEPPGSRGHTVTRQSTTATLR